MGNKNNIFIISGPSGAGEDSIIEGIKKYFELEKIITCTTRAEREGEKNGKDYYFLSRDEFEAGIAAGDFVEYAYEYDNYYGVRRQEIERVMNCGKIGIWKIAYKGVITAKKLFPDIIAILISAPLDQLEARIRNRDKVTEEFIKSRLAYTKEFLNHTDMYDYEILNEDGKLEKSVQKVRDIIRANVVG